MEYSNKKNDLNDYDEITINFKQLWHILWYRKYWIVGCYVVIITTIMIATLFMPKKYVSKAVIFINQSSYTNLADINPFVVSSTGNLTSSSGGLKSLFSGTSSGIDEEISLMKSDEVLTNVIKENNLKVQKGPRKGEYILPMNLANSKNLEIVAGDTGRLLQVSYKAGDPSHAYEIVNSLIKNYIKYYEAVNTEVATRDREFLETTYTEAEESFNFIIKEIARFNSSDIRNFLLNNQQLSNMSLSEFLLRRYDKRLLDNFQELPQMLIEGVKLENELELEVKKLELLKQKYEWSKLVEQLSKNAHQVRVINKPVKLDPDRYSEPNFIINFLISLVISFTFACGIVFYLEAKDKKLTFSDIQSDYIDVLNLEYIDLEKLIFEVYAKKLDSITVLSFLDDEKTTDFISLLKEQLTDNSIQISTYKLNKALIHQIKEIGTLKNLILLSQIGFTDRKSYRYLLNSVIDIKNNILKQYVLK
jgi:uncharacterized protein involved in exopolysaccharide biosynthesis